MTNSTVVLCLCSNVAMLVFVLSVSLSSALFTHPSVKQHQNKNEISLWLRLVDLYFI